MLAPATMLLAQPRLSSRGHFPASPAVPGVLGDLPDLDTYLVLQKQRFPGASVSAGFYDWRTVSKYRRQAGLHLGYDVAMPAGSPAVAGWTGQVTRVAQWFGSEYGITVVSPSGFEVTYGHLSPRVKVGDVLNPGDVVGVVVVDHVDIKMRAPNGLYFDFGHSTPPAGAPGPGIGMGPWMMVHPPALTRDEELAYYVTSTLSAQVGQEEVLQARDAEAEARRSYETERGKVLRARADLPKLRQFLEEGLIARVELEEAERRVGTGGSSVAELESQWRSLRLDRVGREARVDAAKRQMAASKARLVRMGLSEIRLKEAVERSMRRQTAQASRLRALKVQASSQKKKLSAARQKKVVQARQEMQRMEALFEQGAVSRMERDRARQKYSTLVGN